MSLHTGSAPQEELPITRPQFGEEEVDAVRQVLASGWVTQGPMTAKFEKAFAERHQLEHALATTSCTAALHLGMIALGVGPGDEVIVPAYTWVTSAYCVEYVGARVVFCDIDPHTYNIDLQAAAAAISPRTRAIMPVHLFGLAVDMKTVTDLAQKHKLCVVEDAACAVGTTYQGRPVGGFGDIGCFSFHPRKVVTTGEGGMVTTRQADLADHIAALRNHGANRRLGPRNPRPYEMGVFDRLGFNLRLSDIQAAIGLTQLARLGQLLAHRRQQALGYTERLKDVPWLRCPSEPAGCGHTYQSYVIRIEDDTPLSRNALMDELAKHKIQSRPGTIAVHGIPYYRENYHFRSEQFPAAHAAQEHTITLPIFPGMTSDHLDYITSALLSAAKAPYSVRKAG